MCYLDESNSVTMGAPRRSLLTIFFFLTVAIKSVGLLSGKNHHPFVTLSCFFLFVVLVLEHFGFGQG